MHHILAVSFMIFEVNAFTNCFDSKVKKYWFNNNSDLFEYFSIRFSTFSVQHFGKY